jgi:curved DNA-binding protein CbpA
MSQPRLSSDELRIFIDRIGRSLNEQPLSIPRDEHRERVAAMLSSFGQINYYAVLKIPASASAIEVHEGYQRMGRLLHPSNAAYLGFEGKEDVLKMLFEQATEAYLTLSQVERRKPYDRGLDPEAWATPGHPPRPDEAKDRAREHYNQALTLLGKEDYHFVVELLKDAVRWDPQADYYALLAQAQAKNPNWLYHALDSYKKALEIGGSNPVIEAALRRLEARISGIPQGSEDGSGGSGDRYDTTGEN